jgi:peptide chain release factor subunit 1
MIVFGVHETIKALEMGTLETLLVFEDLDMYRYQTKHPMKGEVKTYYLNSTQKKDPKYFKDQENSLDLEVIADDMLSEWLCHNYLDFGATLEFITDKS